MRLVLFVAAVITLLLSIGGCVGAKTAIHEIQGMISLVVSAVLFCGAAIVEAVERLRADVNRAQQPPAA